MNDIFKTNLICDQCSIKTERAVQNKNGFQIRAWVCPKCNKQWIHPLDQKKYEKFSQIKDKNYKVKLRMVGNSYTISIPKEIILFHELEKEMNKIINLTLEEPTKLSLFFTKTRKLIKEDF